MTLKTVLKRGIGSFASSNFGIRTLKPWQHGTANIWITHYYGIPRVYLDDRVQDLSVSGLRTRLRRARSYFRFVTLSELLATDDPRAVALTFDDGFDLEREGVLDVFSELRVPATFFLVERCIDNAHLMWRHALFAMNRMRDADAVIAAYGDECQSPVDGTRSAMGWKPVEIPDRIERMWSNLRMPTMAEFLDEHKPYFTSSQVEALLSDGHEIGCHTASHYDCSRLGEKGLEVEVVEATQTLAAKFRTGPISFAYPFGLRANASFEVELIDRGTVTAVLGTSGCSPRGTPRHSLERLDVEMDWNRAVYVQPGVDIAFARLRK